MTVGLRVRLISDLHISVLMTKILVHPEVCE